MFFKVGEVVVCKSDFGLGNVSIKRGEKYTVSEMDYNGWISLKETGEQPWRCERFDPVSFSPEWDEYLRERLASK